MRMFQKMLGFSIQDSGSFSNDRISGLVVVLPTVFFRELDPKKPIFSLGKNHVPEEHPHCYCFLHRRIQIYFHDFKSFFISL